MNILLEDTTLPSTNTADLRSLRGDALKSAMEKIVKPAVLVYREELQASIGFTRRGIKECINQPFRHFVPKLEMIRDNLELSLRNSVYEGFQETVKGGKEHVKGYHYFRTEIANHPAYFNVELTVQNKLILYTITDSINKKAPIVLSGYAIQCRFERSQY